MVDRSITASPVRRVRGWLGRTRASVVGTRGLHARAARQASELTRLRERTAVVEKGLAAQRSTLEEQARRLKELQDRVSTLDRALTLRTVEHGRREIQFGTIEERLGAVEERLRDGRLVPLDASEAEARDLLEEVRAEHARLRARMQIVSGYEERLRRVEESVAELYDGDPRHLV